MSDDWGYELSCPECGVKARVLVERDALRHLAACRLITRGIERQLRLALAELAARAAVEEAATRSKETAPAEAEADSGDQVDENVR